MKFFKNILSLFLLLFLVLGCQNDPDHINISTDHSGKESNAFQNVIGYTQPKNDGFVEINQGQLLHHWRNTFELEENVKFNPVKLIKAEVSKGEDQYYMLQATNKTGNISISSKVLLSSNNNYLLTGETCKCASANCEKGCDVLSMCACSPCSSEPCEKTSTLAKLNPSLFEL